MPKEKTQGVQVYTYGQATVRIAFANGAVCCKNCEYLLNDRGLGRALCKLQHNKVIPLDFTDGIDCDCPITFEEADLR